MKVGKPKSKRVPVRLRHKIEKSSAAKQRKQRKEAKKNPQWRSRLKKDPGIPNLFPYKAKVLAEIEEGRRRKEEDAQRRREVAKAQRLGTSVEVVRQEADAVAAAAAAAAAAAGGEEEDDELLDDADEDEEDEEMDTQDDSSNPMAALLASAQARAQTYTKDGEVEGIADEDDAAEENDEWDGIADDTTTSAARPALPKQALADPIKAVSALVARMHTTTDGIERLIAHYHIPPITGVTASDFHTRFLVEVARKRGRLGRGGVPNLHSAALAVLGDVHDGRLELPAAAAVESRKSGGGPVGKKGEVQIVSRMAEPFRLEGLWGDGGGKEQVDTGGQTDMVVES